MSRAAPPGLDRRLAGAAQRGVRPALLSPSNRRTRAAVGRTLVFACAVALSAVFALPLLWMISTSLKADPELFATPPVWVPHQPQWGNYPAAFSYIPYFHYMGNTLFIAALVLVGTLFSCAFVAYGFARLSWPGRNALFIVVLATMMLPYQVTMIPLFVVFRQLGWLNTYAPLIVPSYFGNAFYIFLLRQFFMTIPHELSDAARIDGCGEVGIFRRILLPLAKPALATVAIFQFLGSWNDFIGPLIYLNNESLYTLALGLSQYQQLHTTEWTMLMAASTTMTLPVIVIFFLAQKHFVRGIVLTGMKG